MKYSSQKPDIATSGLSNGGGFGVNVQSGLNSDKSGYIPPQTPNQIDGILVSTHSDYLPPQYDVHKDFGVSTDSSYNPASHGTHEVSFGVESTKDSYHPPTHFAPEVGVNVSSHGSFPDYIPASPNPSPPPPPTYNPPQINPRPTYGPPAPVPVPKPAYGPPAPVHPVEPKIVEVHHHHHHKVANERGEKHGHGHGTVQIGGGGHKNKFHSILKDLLHNKNKIFNAFKDWHAHKDKEYGWDSSEDCKNCHDGSFGISTGYGNGPYERLVNYGNHRTKSKNVNLNLSLSKEI